MPWSLRKFLSKDHHQSPVTGGDKERSKEEKHSKLGKLRQQFSKGGDPETVQTQAAAKNDICKLEIQTSLSTFPEESSNSDTRSHVPIEGNDRGQKEDNRPFKSEESYPVDDAKSADSSDYDFRDQNLTCYLENAILESANSTLDRSARLKQQVNDSSNRISLTHNDKDWEENMENVHSGKDFLSTELPCTTTKGLPVEYVNYDLLSAAAGSNGSSEYYSSDNEDNPTPNSNNSNNCHEQVEIGTNQSLSMSVEKNSNGEVRRMLCRSTPTENSLKLSQAEGERGSGNSLRRNDQRNNHSARKSYEEESRPVNAAKRTAADEKSQNETRPCSDETVEHSIDNHGASGATLSVVGKGYVEDNSRIIPGNEDYKRIEQEGLAAKRLEVNPQHDEQCPLRTGIKDINPDITDMERARSIFGMCLCQNGEKVDNVTELDFRNCNLKQVPNDIFLYASTLTRLQLDSNTLSELPKSLFSCENIEYLTVSDNDLGSLPPTLAGLSALTYLDISKNVIEDVPDCIRCCKNLHVLDASVNPIERLTEGFTQLIGLRELYLNDCFLEFLPASFGRLVQLTVLELRDNQLQILPKSIRRLGLLKRLDLGGNIFQEWPDVVCDLRKLTELWLDGNELSRVPLELGELSSLVYLDLSRNFIEAIPNQIGSLCELTDLLLCENHISTLPETIGFLEKLTMIKVSMNQLTSIPESIGKLHAVEELDLSHNKLGSIPSSIGNLRQMHTLLLDNNMLNSVPPELGRCCRINVLQLSRNLLQRIPAEIGDLSRLRVLNVCRNKLEHLPINIIKLAQLEALWVSSNQSKPNVPLHAELGPDGKTRILTNVLFPQREHETSQARSKTDGDGYANDAADDDEPEILRRQRGVTRVAFNLEPLHHSDEDDDVELTEDDDLNSDVPSSPRDVNSNDKRKGDVNSDEHHAVDVSADVISSNGTDPTLQPSLMVKALSDRSGSVMNGDLDSKMDNEASLDRPVMSPSYVKESSDPGSKHPDILQDSGNSRKSQPMPSTSSATISEQDNDNEPTNVGTTHSETRAEDPAQPSKIRTWSSHSHLPSIPQTNDSDDVRPVAVEIIGKDDRSSLSGSPSSGPENTAVTSSMSADDLPPPPVEILNPYQENPTHLDEQSDNPLTKEAKSSKSSFEVTNIPFMDSDDEDGNAAAVKSDREITTSSTKPKKTKPPVPPRIDSVLTKDMKPNSAASFQKEVVKSAVSLSGVSGLKVFTPALLQNRSNKTNEANWSDGIEAQDVLLLPSDKPEASGDGLAATDKDSGVGNDVDSQESIPECADEQDEMMISPTSTPSHDYSRGKNASGSDLSAKPQTPTKPGNIRSVANIRVADSKTQLRKQPEKKLPNYAPVILPTPASNCPNTAVPNTVQASKAAFQNSNKVSQSIRMFESISSPERKSSPASKSLVDLLPSGPRKVEEKAIIRPNNHLNGFTGDKVVPEVAPEKPVVGKALEASNLIVEAEADRVMFVRSDDSYGDSFTFSKVGGGPLQPGSPGDADAGSGQDSPSKRKPRTSSKSKFDETLESVKQTQFRERLEKIMQQQRNVAQASRVAQNGAALSLSRKSSWPSLPQQSLSPTSPNYLSDRADGVFETVAGDPANFEPVSATDTEQKVTKKQSIHERMKSKLERNDKNPRQPAVLKSNSASRVSRTRPGSAPAAQLLQRRGSSQRNSIAAPESGFEEKRTLVPLYGANERAGLDARARSKSIEQQLGQLLLDSDEEQQNYNDRTKYGRCNNDVVRRENGTEKGGAGIRSSRNSLCSPPPVRHNMYAKARSSKNAASVPLADWKHKLLQHIERKRMEKNQINTLQNAGRNRTRQQYSQSIGHIKSPPRTSGPPPRPHQPHPANFYSEKESSNYVVLSPPQARPETHQVPRQMSKCVTAPTLGAATRTTANGHQYAETYSTHMGDNVHLMRGQYEASKRSSNPTRLAKQRTFTPGPESFANTQPVAPRPKSAMDKFSSPPREPLYAEPPVFRQNQQSGFHKDHRAIPPPLPSYETYLQRRANYAPFVVENHQNRRLVRADPIRRSHRAASSNRGNYEDLAGFPLRQTGSHESLMDAARFDRKPNYFREQPIRNASSHDSVLDQPLYRQQPRHSPTYADPYYSSPPHNYPANVPQRYPAVHPVVENHKRAKYNAPDYATYVNVYNYDQAPVEYRNQPGVEYRPQPGYVTRNSRDHPHTHLNPAQSYKHEQSNYKTYAKVPQDYRHITDSRQQQQQPQPYNGHQYSRHHEVLSPTLYRPLAEREDGSVASAFKPYNQIQQQHKGHLHHHHMGYHGPQYGLPPNNVISPTDYKGQRTLPSVQYHQRGGGYIPEQPRHGQPNDWNEMSEDAEVVTVSVRRNPTFGFHVMGGVGAGGNPYRPQDDGVFITHVTPGGAADGKLQAGDKILLVNGSDFVGISHQRAVDLLRNAGQVAVLVVQRLLGKPV